MNFIGQEYFYIFAVFMAINSLPLESNQGFCLTEVCNRTSAYLGLKTLSQSTIDPCDDFGEFLRGGWKENRPKPLITDVFSTVYERMVKILTDPSATNNFNILKVAKKVFKNCLDSGL